MSPPPTPTIFKTSSKPKYFPQAPNTITLEVRASMYEFGGNINIQFITDAFLKHTRCDSLEKQNKTLRMSRSESRDSNKAACPVYIP